MICECLKYSSKPPFHVDNEEGRKESKEIALRLMTPLIQMSFQLV